ncbi:MAG: Fe2+-dependent dioxygenase [Gammaproteobacteria bacterium]
MIVRILKMLQTEQLQLIDELMNTGEFIDGASTTGVPTKPVKHNLQLDMANHPRQAELYRAVTELFTRHPMLRSSTYPKKMTMPLLSSYSEGQSYGWHIDNPIMPSPSGPVRADVACTAFLTDSKDYDGGELHISTHSGDVKIKLERGDVILYPAMYRHQVTPVTRGVRLAMVFWIQSMVQDVSRREVLHDLNMAYNHIYQEKPDSEALPLIQRTQSNLVRRWAEN